MEYLTENNIVRLSGRVVSGPKFSHKTFGEAFYLIMLGIFRKSGYEDRIRLIMSERLMGGRAPGEGENLDIYGQIRTYNREIDGRNKLEVTIFVKEMAYGEQQSFAYENNVFIEGFICKEPVRRTSPLGREICDLMIAVNRMYNKSDYIPSIAWGRNAVYAESLRVGDKVSVQGRIQSREYRKFTEEGQLITKTAYEVSVTKLETIIISSHISSRKP